MYNQRAKDMNWLEWIVSIDKLKTLKKRIAIDKTAYDMHLWGQKMIIKSFLDVKKDQFILDLR